GTLNNIAELLTVRGQNNTGGVDTLNADDTADTASNEGVLTSTRLTGLGLGGNDPAKGILYESFVVLNIRLGSGDDRFTVESTHPATTVIDAGAGSDKVAVKTTAGPTTVNTADGNDTVNVGTQSTPDAALGTLNAIGELLTVRG